MTHEDVDQHGPENDDGQKEKEKFDIFLNKTREKSQMILFFFPTFAWNERLEEQNGGFVAGPGVHFAVGIAAFLRQLVPGLGLGEELGDGALREAEDELGEESLADVVHGEELADAARNSQRVQGLAGVALHRGAQHLLETGLERVALGQQRCQTFRKGHQRG